MAAPVRRSEGRAFFGSVGLHVLSLVLLNAAPAARAIERATPPDADASFVVIDVIDQPLPGLIGTGGDNGGQQSMLVRSDSPSSSVIARGTASIGPRGPAQTRRGVLIRERSSDSDEGAPAQDEASSTIASSVAEVSESSLAEDRMSDEPTLAATPERAGDSSEAAVANGASANDATSGDGTSGAGTGEGGGVGPGAGRAAAAAIVAALPALFDPCAAAPPWTGVWEGHSRDGSHYHLWSEFTLTLQQTGDVIRGTMFLRRWGPAATSSCGFDLFAPPAHVYHVTTPLSGMVEGDEVFLWAAPGRAQDWVVDCGMPSEFFAAASSRASTRFRLRGARVDHASGTWDVPGDVEFGGAAPIGFIRTACTTAAPSPTR